VAIRHTKTSFFIYVIVATIKEEGIPMSKRLGVAFFFLFLLLTWPANAQKNPDLAAPQIVINLPSRTLEFYSGNALVKEYPVAIGKPSTPTPLGNFYIINKEINPIWYPPKGGPSVPSGPENPLGYRWLGFLPMYGIHGTNAPWTIGYAISNGCIRMYEEDVEELFEVVRYGTPVKITYERVKIRIAANGEVSIGIYPDIYGYQHITVADVCDRLAKLGLNGIASEDIIKQLIDEEADKQVVVARLGKLAINDQMLAEHVIVKENIVFVPVAAVADIFNTRITWDEAGQKVQGAGKAVPGVVFGDTVYVTAQNLEVLFGGYGNWNAEGNIFTFSQHTTFVNGIMVSRRVAKVGEVLAVPVMPLSEAMGQKVTWNKPAKAILLGNTPLPVTFVADEPYIKITDIHKYFQAYVHWNIPARCIDVIYPFNYNDGGSY